MKGALYTLSVLFMLALVAAEAREFTNKAGKTISAEIESGMSNFGYHLFTTRGELVSGRPSESECLGAGGIL